MNNQDIIDMVNLEKLKGNVKFSVKYNVIIEIKNIKYVFATLTEEQNAIRLCFDLDDYFNDKMIRTYSQEVRIITRYTYKKEIVE